MTLEDYIIQLRAEIDAFEREYRAGIVVTPHLYPKELEPGEWDEQFISHINET